MTKVTLTFRGNRTLVKEWNEYPAGYRSRSDGWSAHMVEEFEGTRIGLRIGDGGDPERWVLLACKGRTISPKIWPVPPQLERVFHHLITLTRMYGRLDRTEVEIDL